MLKYDSLLSEISWFVTSPTFILAIFFLCSSVPILLNLDSIPVVFLSIGICPTGDL